MIVSLLVTTAAPTAITSAAVLPAHVPSTRGGLLLAHGGHFPDWMLVPNVVRKSLSVVPLGRSSPV